MIVINKSTDEEKIKFLAHAKEPKGRLRSIGKPHNATGVKHMCRQSPNERMSFNNVKGNKQYIHQMPCIHKNSRGEKELKMFQHLHQLSKFRHKEGTDVYRPQIFHNNKAGKNSTEKEWDSAFELKKVIHDIDSMFDIKT